MGGRLDGEALRFDVGCRALVSAAQRISSNDLRSNRLRRIEAPPADPRGVLAGEWFDCHRPEAGIGDAVATGGREQPGGQHRVQRCRILRVRLRIAIVLEKVERTHQLGAAGHGRSARIQRVTAVASRDRIPLGGVVAGEVGESHRAALATQVGDDSPRDLAAVERIGAALGDLLERPRQIGIADGVTGGERAAVAEEEGAAAVILEKMLTLRRECRRQTVADDVTVAGRPDRRSEQIGPAHLAAAILLPREVHGGDRARNVGENGSVVRQAAVLQQLGVGEAGVLRHAGHELDQLRRRHLGPIDEHFTVSTGAARIRLDDA